MEISGLGQPGEINLGDEKSANDVQKASDAFSQLLAALFLNMSQSNQNTQLMQQASDTLQESSTKGAAEIQGSIDNNFVSMLRNMNIDALKLLQGSKNENSDIQSILQELGMMGEQDVDNVVNCILNANNTAAVNETKSVNGQLSKDNQIPDMTNITKNFIDKVKESMEKAKEDDGQIESLMERIDMLNNRVTKLKINGKNADDKQSLLKILNSIKNNMDIKGINDTNSDAKVIEVNNQANVNKMDTDSKNDFNALHNNEQTAIFANRQVSTDNGLKEFEDASNVQKDIQTPFIQRPEDLIDVTVNRFKFLKLPDFTEMRVKLRPEELGEVTVKVVLEKGQINGSILADRKEVVSMLQNQIDYLKNELKNNNINFSNVTVYYDASGDLDGHNASRNFNQQGKNNGRRYLMEVEENSEESKSKTGFTIIA